MIHDDLRGVEAWIAKHNRYSTYNAGIYTRLLSGAQAGSVKRKLWGNQAERKRFIKHYIWPHLPGRALFFFLYMYFLRLGFLDGVHGFHFCVMHAIFQQFVVIKQWEQKQMRIAASPVRVSESSTASDQPVYEETKLIS
jgi:hypothetical protein